MNEKYVLERTGDYHENLMESLVDKKYAVIYLKVALEEYEIDGDSHAFMLALRHVAEAQGGLGKLAKKAGLDRVHLYRTLSEKGNPELFTLENILRALGFRLSIELA
jgi:probable addiction module antidote protein